MTSFVGETCSNGECHQREGRVREGSGDSAIFEILLLKLKISVCFLAPVFIYFVKTLGGGLVFKNMTTRQTGLIKMTYSSMSFGDAT